MYIYPHSADQIGEAIQSLITINSKVLQFRSSAIQQFSRRPWLRRFARRSLSLSIPEIEQANANSPSISLYLNIFAVQQFRSSAIQQFCSRP